MIHSPYFVLCFWVAAELNGIIPLEERKEKSTVSAKYGQETVSILSQCIGICWFGLGAVEEADRKAWRAEWGYQ